METPKFIGETTITAKNQVSLPASGLRLLGRERGDHLLVEAMADDMVLLVRRPRAWAEAYAGRLTDVFGPHEENIRWLEEQRQSWAEK